MEIVKAKLRLFLSRFFTNYQLGDTEDIFSLGFVNSLFAMQLIQFIEKEFNIVVDNNDLDLNNFRTIESITIFVTRKQM